MNSNRPSQEYEEISSVQDTISMKELLSKLFTKSVELGDEDYTDFQIESKWIGNSPATEQEIKEAEVRLGIELPHDYKELLKVANGFLTSMYYVEPTFHKVSEIDYYRNYKWNVIQGWKQIDGLEGVVAQLDRAIIIAGKDNDQQFLLIPPTDEDEEWKYWKFAMWIPGKEEYKDLKNYIIELTEFIESTIQEQE